MFTDSGSAAWPDQTVGKTHTTTAHMTFDAPRASYRARVMRPVCICLLVTAGLVASVIYATSPLRDDSAAPVQIHAQVKQAKHLSVAVVSNPPPLTLPAPSAPPVEPETDTAANTAPATKLPVSLTGRFGLLSQDALDEYRVLQDALAKANWQTFNARITMLSDDRLAAAFAGMKLLHPAYKPTQPEMAGWLTRNPSAALAPAVYARAVETFGKGAGFTVPTAAGPLSGDDREADGNGDRTTPAATVAKAQPARLIEAVATFIEGDENKPLDMQPETVTADAAAPEAQPETAAAAAAPSPAWRTGLAAWQRGDMESAREIFTRLAADDDAHKYDRAGALFWSGRAAAALHDNAGARSAWQAAAKLAPRSFYGLLAMQSLGTTPTFNWPEANLTPSDIKELTSLSAGTRALMWLELGDRDMAEAELRQGLTGGIKSASAPQRRAMLMLAASEHLPNLAYGMAGQASGRNSALRLPALYPVPAWEPKGGFVTSTALVYALVRQESAFNPIAKSARGAMGAMQIMPDTAARVADIADRHEDKLTAHLLTPENNIALGERYLQSLARDGAVRGNLVKLIAAYNCGSGNLQRWMDDANTSDPILYIEQLPARETRSFVQSVMANYWMYQSELGEPSPTLKTMARGDWPRLDFKQPVATELASAR